MFKKPGFYFGILLALIIGFLFYEVWQLKIIPQTLFYAVLVVCFVLWLIVTLLICGILKGKISRAIGWILAFAVAIVSCFGVFYAYQSNQLIESVFSSSDPLNNATHVYVLAGSSIENPEQLQDRTIGILKNSRQQGSQECLNSLEEMGISVSSLEYDSSSELYQALVDGKISAMILESAYLVSLSEMDGMQDVESKVKSIYTYSYASDASASESALTSVDTTETPFNVLISGIDTRENAILQSSRSDVNLLMSVNPEAREILLISIPRDFYVQTACEADMGCMQGAMDKLTHTGLHGIETTEMTLEKLFGIEINYNVKVNFSSLVSIVDLLGGIEVDNPNTFEAGGYTFQKGVIHLDGSQALAFVRERYSFSLGDRERGRNQMRVLKAILEKAMSPAILNNLTSMISTISSSVVTNMPYKDVVALIQSQIANSGSWSIYTFSVDGTGGTDYAAELGSNAYVMYPDQTTIDQAKADIEAVFNGEVPLYLNDIQ